MAKRKSIQSYNEDINKVEERIEELKEKMKEERKKLKELEDGKRAEQGTILLEKFWEHDIQDFDKIEDVIDGFIDKKVIQDKDLTSREEREEFNKDDDDRGGIY